MSEKNPNKHSDPLLYITQPETRKPVSHEMQDSYHFRVYRRMKKKKRERLEKFLPPPAEWEGEPVSDGTLTEQAAESFPSNENEPVLDSLGIQAESEQAVSARPQEATEEIETEKKQHMSGLRPVKPFRHMNIPEKISYLETGIAVLPCEFTTAVKSVKGILVRSDDEWVYVETSKGFLEQVKRDELASIRISRF